jgi:hypothetical protein
VTENPGNKYGIEGELLKQIAEDVREFDHQYTFEAKQQRSIKKIETHLEDLVRIQKKFQEEYKRPHLRDRAEDLIFLREEGYDISQAVKHLAAQYGIWTDPQ